DPLATQVVQVVTATPEPTSEAEEGAVIAPTLEPIATQVEVNTEEETTETPETEEVAVLGAPTTEGDTDTDQTSPQAQSQSVDSDIPVELASLVSNLVRVEGGEFQYGTDALEVTTAANECQQRDGGQC